mmetsp:Transcript_75520/g.157524  ORF Transcript_75520/g.157524 Transcript_75520/m.157524 type:complete len:141 (-) Transcript_75520:286-708(-)
MEWATEVDEKALGAMERLGHRKALCVGLLAGCGYSILQFKVRRKVAPGPKLAIQALLTGTLAGLAVEGYTTFSIMQIRRQAEALERFSHTADTVRVIKIDNGSPPIPVEEMDAATGVNAAEANAALWKQIREQDNKARHK